MLKNIVFDMGGVLIDYDPDAFVERLNVPKEDRRLLRQEVFSSPEWAWMDEGKLQEEEYIEILKERLPERLHKEMETLVLHWDEPLIQIEGMKELIAGLKEEGYKIYLLSNASVRQHEYWPRISASVYFDGTLVSADERLVKPDPEIYRRLSEKFGLALSECLFIDDMERNLQGAKSVGMKTFLFKKNPEELKKYIKEGGSR